MRILLNFLAVCSLATGLLFAVFDIARSIALNRYAILPLSENLRNNLPEYFSALAGFMQNNFGQNFWQQWLLPLLQLPGALLFVIMSLVFFAAGRLGRNQQKL